MCRVSRRPASGAQQCCFVRRVPHLIKRFVDRGRPDLERFSWHGIPRSGNRNDSFPSGHALHLGALASALTRRGPSRLRPFVWPAAIGLASTRLLRTHPVKAADGMMFRLLSLADLSSNSTAGVRRAWMLDGH
jgi:hypothetical protein